MSQESAKTKKPLVSVIIPNYNSKKTINQCLASVLSALPADKEVIVVDDVSTDESPEIISKYPVRLFRLEKNSGPAQARDFGVKKSNGSYLVFIDSDVIIQKDTIVELVKVIKDKQAGGVLGLSTPLSKDLVSFSFVARSLGVSSVSDKKIREVDSVGAGLTAYPRKVFEELQGYDEEFRVGEDLEFNIRLKKAGYKQFLVPSATAYHDHPSTIEGVARKWFQYGYWLFRVQLKHNQKTEVFKILGWIFSTIFLLILTTWTGNFLFLPFLLLTFFAPWLVYYGKSTIELFIRTREMRVLIMPIVHMTAILSRTAGFFWSICSKNYFIFENSLIKNRDSSLFMSSSKNNALEQIIDEIIRKEEPETVRQLIALIKVQENFSEEQIVTVLRNMESKNLVKLNSKSTVFPGFRKYLLSSSAVWYWLTLLIVFLTFLSIFVIPDFSVLTLVKKTFAGLSIFLLPGYTLTIMVFKYKKASSENDTLRKEEFIFYSVLISLVFIPMSALLLDYTSLGVRLVPVVMISLTSSSVFATIAAILDISNIGRQKNLLTQKNNCNQE
jgi:glycosyltransferase involved in cell wall biosynthesis